MYNNKIFVYWDFEKAVYVLWNGDLKKETLDFFLCLLATESINNFPACYNLYANLKYIYMLSSVQQNFNAARV